MKCAACRNVIPELAARYGDAFCSTECAKEFYGVKIAEPERHSKSYLREHIENIRRERLTRSDSIPHGTENGYVNYLCRCGLCREAATQARVRRRERIGGTRERGTRNLG